VTVTLPIHPLRGESLPVLRAVRDRKGRSFVEAQHPDGWTLRLPVEWTDRAHPSQVVTVAGRAARATADDLLQLVRVARSMMEHGEFLDGP